MLDPQPSSSRAMTDTGTMPRLGGGIRAAGAGILAPNERRQAGSPTWAACAEPARDRRETNTQASLINRTGLVRLAVAAPKQATHS